MTYLCSYYKDIMRHNNGCLSCPTPSFTFEPRRNFMWRRTIPYIETADNVNTLYSHKLIMWYTIYWLYSVHYYHTVYLSYCVLCTLLLMCIYMCVFPYCVQMYIQIIQLVIMWSIDHTHIPWANKHRQWVWVFRWS